MTIECYTTECPWHSCNTQGEEGPFCYEVMCRQYLCEQGYWMVAWNEPGEIIGSAVRSIEIREAIASSKHSAAMKGYFYLNDLEALSDFITIHYAWFERKETDHE